MNTIPKLRTFNPEELFDLFRECAQCLIQANAVLHLPQLAQTAQEAYCASDFMGYVMEKEALKTTPPTIH